MLDQIQRRRRAVHTHDFGSAKHCRLHAPATDVAIEIQHALAGYIGRQSRAVHAVVVEPAGLLASPDRRFEGHAVLFKRYALGHLAMHRLDYRWQPFQGTRSIVILEQDAGRLEHLNQRLDDRFTHPLHARR